MYRRYGLLQARFRSLTRARSVVRVRSTAESHPPGDEMVSEADVRKALRKVKDPELHLDIVVLGLIYDLKIEGSHVDVTMSLTSPTCPVAGELLNRAREAVEELPGVESADVELTFSPPWSADRINPTIRAALGL
jgi:metal-sulfur cluster biosynthetic enzyme